MGLQKIVVLCVLGVVLVAGWLYFSGNQNQSESNLTANNGQNPTVESEPVATDDDAGEVPLAGLGSFASLMALGQSLRCDFSYVAPETRGAVAGTVYIDGENIRNDFDMEQAGQLFESHMIQDGEYAYSWSQSPQGTFAIKTPVNDEDDSGIEFDTSPSANRSVDLDHQVEYDCQVWSADPSMFVPPADIEFLSIDEMIQNALGGANLPQ